MSRRMMREDRQAGIRGERAMQAAFAVLALGSLVLGALLYVFSERFGLGEASARLIATAFIGAGVIDAAVLYYWDRLFTRR